MVVDSRLLSIAVLYALRFLLVGVRLLFVVCCLVCLSFVGCCSLFDVCCLLVVACCGLFDACCFLFNVSRVLFVFVWLVGVGSLCAVSYLSCAVC